MQIKRILWATDGSIEAEEALKYAVLLAKEYSAEIVGIYISSTKIKNLYSDLYLLRKKLFNNLVKADEVNLEARFNSIKTKLRSQGLDFTSNILRGEASTRIINFAQNEKADLIVMGTRGHGLLDKVLIGSTTLKVLKKSKIPILAFKRREKKRPGIKNILVPIDVYEKKGSALEYATDLATVINARVFVVYSIRMVGHLYSIPSVLNELIRDSSKELIQRVEEIKVKRGLNSKKAGELRIKTKVLHSINPAVAIADYALAKNIDLIVINTHSRGGIKRLVLGSTAENVIQSSHCSTLVIRP
jgi:nucleotide-binding universal stress UspA family protein